MDNPKGISQKGEAKMGKLIRYDEVEVEKEYSCPEGVIDDLDVLNSVLKDLERRVRACELNISRIDEKVESHYLRLYDKIGELMSNPAETRRIGKRTW